MIANFFSNSILTLVATVVLTSLSFASSLSAEDTEVHLDLEQSQIKWVGKKVTGQHNGLLKLESGKLWRNKDSFRGGEFVLDMASIENLDIESESYKKKLENHLKSDDFFDVEKFPKGSFYLTEISQKEDGSYEISGNLTLKDITKQISFPAEITEEDGVYTAKAKTTIDRADFNVKYNSGRFFDAARLGDKLIYDEIEVELELYGKSAA